MIGQNTIRYTAKFLRTDVAWRAGNDHRCRPAPSGGHGAWAASFPLITIGLDLAPHIAFAALRAGLAGVCLIALGFLVIVRRLSAFDPGFLS